MLDVSPGKISWFYLRIIRNWFLKRARRDFELDLPLILVSSSSPKLGEY